jgi:glycosyltransferase involved in cell wall biosynthesis
METRLLSQSGPLVTVGVPTFNRPEGLRHTLQSVCGQTYQNLEILISDNCSSTEETRSIALAWQQADPRVRYTRQERNLGIEANFKYLLGKARGEYFAWAADDDHWTPDFVSVCLHHIGQAGSVMTGMRTAVRSQNLLRWKPPCHLSPSRGAFENAVAFFNNLQPSLIYGIHRTAQLRRFLSEELFDYYDCFFVLRQILTSGFVTAAPVCFHVGVDSDLPVYKPAHPRQGAVYEYWPFLRASLCETLRSNTLTWTQKLRLCYLLCYVALNEFTHFEQAARPLRAAFAKAGQRALQSLRWFLGVPLPPHPTAMVFPPDAGDICTLLIDQSTLENASAMRAHVLEAQKQLAAKLNELAQRCGPRPLDCSFELAPLAEDSSLAEVRFKLGRLLLKLEQNEDLIHPETRAGTRIYPSDAA